MRPRPPTQAESARESATTSLLAQRHWWVWRNAVREAENGDGKLTEPLPPIGDKRSQP